MNVPPIGPHPSRISLTREKAYETAAPTNALPHLSGSSVGGMDELEVARDARVLADFQAADVIVIGAPMYTFTIPTQLNAWIDRILVAGKTFRYTDAGSQGLAISAESREKGMNAALAAIPYGRVKENEGGAAENVSEGMLRMSPTSVETASVNRTRRHPSITARPRDFAEAAASAMA